MLSGEMKLALVVCLALNAFQSDAASLRRSGRSKLTFIEDFSMPQPEEFFMKQKKMDRYETVNTAKTHHIQSYSIQYSFWILLVSDLSRLAALKKTAARSR